MKNWRSRAAALPGRRTLALVPTMGALHAGHMALVDEAKRRADRVAATIFVNPTQFAAGEDLDRYPRREEEDAQMLRGRAAATCCGCRRSRTSIRTGFATTVSVAGVSERWEGEARPGHFDGVATVVAKLLLAVAPDVALFGEKDFQQLAVIRRMVADLDISGRDRRRADGARAGWPRPVVAQRLSLGRRSAQRAGALPHALEAAREAILRRRAVADSARSGAQAGAASTPASRGSTISRWSTPRRSSRSSARTARCG